MLKILVYVDFFQPILENHIAELRSLESSNSDATLCVLNCSGLQPRGLRSPLSSEIVKQALEEQGINCTTESALDPGYQLANWQDYLSELVHSLFSNLSGSANNPKSKSESNSDSVSNIEITIHHGIQLRAFLKSSNDYIDAWNAPDQIRFTDNTVKNAYLEQVQYFKAEREYVEQYQHAWAPAPYPPIFVTTDALVTCNGHILVIKRGQSPGKNLWALPGGFLDQFETTLEGCLRELKEETCLDLNLLVADVETIHSNSKIYDFPLRSIRGRTLTHLHRFDLDKLNLSQLPKIKAMDDAAEAFWQPISQLKRMCFFEDHFQILVDQLSHIEMTTWHNQSVPLNQAG